MIRSNSFEAWVDAWSNLGGAQLPPTPERLHLKKAGRFERLRKLGLLRTPVVSARVDQFLMDPEKFMRQVPGSSLMCFIDAPAAATGLPQLSSGPIEREHLISHLEKYVAVADAKSLTMTFLKAHRIILNGNIFVMKDEEFYAEFVAGPRSPSQQSPPVACAVTRHPFLRVFSYSSDDPDVRSAVHSIIQALPGNGTGRSRVFLPGYYEVGLGVDEESRISVPLFYDYRDEDFFLTESRYPRSEISTTSAPDNSTN